ncbi:ATP-binding cassette domain-containing protein [Phenylobacterium sp.]|uniref:cell division ATP-binding protein FtsE n=1 Tax=Phenylobacterium sp. TaxID=1871053 RepID=UPI0025E0D228|nr:ATP-binding cassette domain-containing protein [Phenylobacterium sp.]
MSRNPVAAAASRAAEEVVRFDDVSMRYGRGPDVLSDLNFGLAPGSFHFVTGASGAGKSSLLKLIYLAAEPSKGRLHLFGQDVAAAPAAAKPQLRRRIGVVFQDQVLLDHLSVFDNAALPLRIAGRKPAEYRTDVAELLSWVGLSARMDAMPATLAGGERQRLAIARAVVNRPDILLADEPTGNVDHEMAVRIFRLFVELNKLGATVLIATHDQDLIARSGRPVLHLEGGRIARRPAPGSAQGAPAQGLI